MVFRVKEKPSIREIRLEGYDEVSEEKIRERREGLMQPSGDGFETRPEIDPNALRGPGAIFSNPRTANAINPGSGDS